MWKKLPEDSFVLGLAVGMATLFTSYVLFRWLRLALVNHYGNPYFFPAPRIQLLAILLNVILFRYIMVKVRKEKTGKGILLSTVVLSFAYFYMFLRHNYQLP